jgi:16S rRNA (cytosine967-C5)-methyltransferase
VAVAILDEVLEKGAYANIALRKALGQSGLDARDRAFVTELVNETLRNLRLIDTVINHFSKLPVDKMKPFIRNVLRVSVCQLRILSKVPPHAAVFEAVSLTKGHGYESLAGFVNGVLRAVVRKPGVPAIPKTTDWPLRYSYPDPLAAKIVEWLGEERACKFARYSHQIPMVTAHTNILKINPDTLAERLRNEGVECTRLDDSFLILKNTGDITGLAAFKEGLFFVMDPGAVWAVKALGLKPGQTMIDMCAAPGGKSFAAACGMGDIGEIYALDIHPHRVGLMDTAIKRLGIKSIKTMARDGTTAHSPDDANGLPQADAVLLDVPCSGLGTLRKRPEIKYRYMDGMESLLQTQRDLLAAAAAYVKPGSVLVYSTCTINREENIDMVRRFCKERPGFTVEPMPELPNDADIPFFVEDGCLQLLPGPHNDGFFAARLKKTE